MTQTAKAKGNEIWKALVDLFILVLLLGAAGFGGYFYGIHQQLAPVQKVAAGTPGAMPAVSALPPPVAGSPSSAVTTPPKPQDSTAPAPTPASTTKHKYWVASSGSDYIGYSILVKVNDTQVDNFFGPGKSVDITNLIKPGDNTVVFEAKSLGDDYNKHSGDKTAVLSVRVIGGPTIQENYKPSDVLATFKRCATDAGDSTETASVSGAAR
jgi:hypothetical protein